MGTGRSARLFLGRFVLCFLWRLLDGNVPKGASAGTPGALRDRHPSRLPGLLISTQKEFDALGFSFS